MKHLEVIEILLQRNKKVYKFHKIDLFIFLLNDFLYIYHLCSFMYTIILL